MGNKRGEMFQIMGVVFLLGLIYMSSFSSATVDEETELVEESELQTYIVHVKRPHPGLGVYTKSNGLESWYESFLPVTIASSNMKQRIIYSYSNVFNGFAAKLTAQEVKAMEEKEGLVSARPQKILSLHTTHSPIFLGLQRRQGFWKESNYGKGVIIGVLYSGLFPDHPSFSDKGMPPPPRKWKGKCDFKFCNNKIIGARTFDSPTVSVTAAGAVPPSDDDGHGTHTASTAAGNFVPNADVLGNANGTAVGMAPLAHLAIYKVCARSCSEADIFAGFDRAIDDGVDVLSISLGIGSNPFFEDPVAVGGFSAIRKGIFVSCAAGNSGPHIGILSNEAPWLLTVGASTIDRKIVATAKLGNGEEYNGESLFQPSNFSSKLLPLVYPGANGDPSLAFCYPDSLKDEDVAGKVALCDIGGGILPKDKGQEVKEAGGAALILANDEIGGFSTSAVDHHVLPTTHVSYQAGVQIKSYIKSKSSPTATITFKGTIIGDPTAPEVASFSSRGPSSESPGILKPDIIGPGVNILAAWPSQLETDASSKPTFNIASGTSMACPHLSGVAALIKSAHPDWSPAAVKSAIMTSADLYNLEKSGRIVDERFQPADLFATGAGHVNPMAANDPGLIYDLEPDDYIPYMCGLGYTDGTIGMIVNKTVKCSEESAIAEAQLNYPSFSIKLRGRSVTYSRTVRNVGAARSSYSLQIMAPSGVEVSVKPDKLEFTKVNQKMTYKVSFSRRRSGGGGGGGGGESGQRYAQGFLKWLSDRHSVRSPISVDFE